MTAPDRGFWRGRTVLLTGHTGFKGAWLSLWLQWLGAEVTGLSLGAPTRPSLYEVARVEENMRESIRADVRDGEAVLDAFRRVRPEVVIHLAAQPLVRRSYAEPRETFATNVMGTVNVLDAARLCESVGVLVNVTSDKCYENPEDGSPLREGDPMGGHDPYSASKGAAELVTAAYRRSFFSGRDGPLLASARAGNVIGGGDWGEDRLVADVIRAALAGRPVHVRNPHAIRPWQHVLCPLGGYLRLTEALWDAPELAGAWNFGPAPEDERSVRWVVERISEGWPGGVRWVEDGVGRPHEGHAPDGADGLREADTPEEAVAPHEAHTLKLDSSLARDRLGWEPAMGLEEAIEATVGWWLALREGEDMREVISREIGSVGGQRSS
jgi:CDP-glucose 4,6-dehydratase